MLITIDGPSGTGKSTVARRVAQMLAATFVDTGAMFRSLAAALLLKEIPLDNSTAVCHFLQNHPLKIVREDTIFRYLVGDLDVTDHIRRRDVTDFASKISTMKEVRDLLKELQRKIAADFCDKTPAVVFEGRDMGTVIFPHAELKIFLTASPEIRACRRYQELVTKDPFLKETLSLQDIERDIQIRDERDSNRALAPLRPASDAHLIDTSRLSIDEVIEKIIILYKELLIKNK
jgi:CMP/dCMP kinase